MSYLDSANSTPLYFVVGGVLLFIALGCMYFIIKAYRAGLKIGMERKVLKKTITSSFLFSILPSVSILLGVIALSGSLGIPTSWLRLSVIGNLSYEAIAANAAAEAMNTTLNASLLTTRSLVTILSVMTLGISGGVICTIFFCPMYSRKCNKLMNKGTKKEGKSFADWAMVSLFIGFCGTFIGSYIAQAVNGLYVPLLVALFSYVIMSICLLLEKKGWGWIENFSLSFAMLLSMAFAVVIN